MKKKKVIVTGGSGYIGTEIVFQLIKKGYSVGIIDTEKPKFPLNKVRFIKHDLTKPLKDKALLHADYVIHLAARVGGISFANSYPAITATQTPATIPYCFF